jgi:hypothetical protein
MQIRSGRQYNLRERHSCWLHWFASCLRGREREEARVSSTSVRVMPALFVIVLCLAVLGGGFCGALIIANSPYDAIKNLLGYVSSPSIYVTCNAGFRPSKEKAACEIPKVAATTISPSASPTPLPNTTAAWNKPDCLDVACPPSSSGVSVGSATGCTCNPGFIGNITPTNYFPYYLGSCHGTLAIAASMETRSVLLLCCTCVACTPPAVAGYALAPGPTSVTRLTLC